MFLKHLTSLLFISIASIGIFSSASIAATPSKQQGKDTLAVTKKPVRTDSTTFDSTIAIPDTTKKTSKSGLTDTVYYSAEGGFIDYDVEKKTMHLIGNACIKYQDITLNADSIIYLIEDGLMIASGKPQLVEKNDTTVGESMVYNIKTKRGRVKYASAHMDDAFFNGNKIIKSEDNALYVDQGDYTTCVKDTPDYFFYGKNVKIVPNDQIICRPVVFALSQTPVLALPFFIFPLNRSGHSGFLTPIWGGRPETNGYLDNIGYYYVPNDYMDVAGWFRVQDFSDVIVNAASHYNLKYVLNGSITGRYATQTQGNLTRSNDWSLDYNHNQNLTPDGNFSLSGRGSLLGQNKFYTNYSEDSAQLLDQTINANLSLSKRFTSINANLSATWTKNQNLSTNKISEDLPSLSFSLPSRPIIPFEPKDNLPDGQKDEQKWYNRLTYSYSANALRKNNVDPKLPEQTYTKSGVSQSANLSAPLTFFNHLTVSPSFNAQLSSFDSYMGKDTLGIDVYKDTTYKVISLAEKHSLPDSTFIDSQWIQINPITNTEDSVFRVIKDTATYRVPLFEKANKWAHDLSWNTGVSMNTILYGVFPIHILNFVGLRHVLTPSIGYTFTPVHKQNKQFYPVAPSAPDKPKQSQSVNLSLSNEFQGKMLEKAETEGEKPVEKKFQILSGGISTAYDFEAERHKWSDLSLNANTSYNIFHVNYGSTFFMYDESDKQIVPLLKQYNISLSTGSLSASGTLWEGDKITLDSLEPKNDIDYRNAGPQKWQASLSPAYTFSQTRTKTTDQFTTSKQYSLSASAGLNMTRFWSVSWSSTYNFTTNQFVSNTFNFHFDQDCWDLRFDWRPGGYNPGYYFMVNIKKIPEIKWENRG